MPPMNDNNIYAKKLVNKYYIFYTLNFHDCLEKINCVIGTYQIINVDNPFVFFVSKLGNLCLPRL